jgi:hypothetical protein
MRRAVLAVLLGLSAAGAQAQGQTLISLQITGLPGLPAGTGPVRLVDVVRLSRPPVPPLSQRLLVSPAPSPEQKGEKPFAGTLLPEAVQTPTYQEGSLVACF